MFQRFFAPSYSGDNDLPSATKYLDWRLARSPCVTSFEDNQAFRIVVDVQRMNEPKMQEYVMQALWWTESGPTIRDGTNYVPPSLPLSRLALGIIRQRSDCFMHRSGEICRLLDKANPSLFEHAMTAVKEVAKLRWPESLADVLESAYKDPVRRKHVLRFLESKSWGTHSPDVAVAMVASALKSNFMRGYVTMRLQERGDSAMNFLKAIGNSSAEVSKMFCAEVTLLAFGGDVVSKEITQQAREVLKNENFTSSVDLDTDAEEQFFSFSTSSALRNRIVNVLAG